ncbi:MAG: hypothetical protein D6690_08890 [Nitrospirae bacterium]|nr:MAG: hypothetical protein D6690_08890 [Nitrospirota bacterium]
MDMTITLKNYRCFEQPARIDLRKGLTALIGVNNSGKSTLLRFFYEFRSFWGNLQSPFLDLIGGKSVHLPPIHGIQDPRSVFCDNNDRDMEIIVEIDPDDKEQIGLADVPLVTKAHFVISRNPLQYTGRFYSGYDASQQVHAPSLSFDSSGLLLSHGQVIADPRRLLETFRALAGCVYLGAFRNALDLQGNQSQYYDIAIGRTLVSNWKS